jgi:hypothetical protein
MNGEGARQGAPDDLLSGRSERSRAAGRNATFAEVDTELELRERLAAIVDSLEAGDLTTAAVNACWLLDDLDGWAAA